MTVVNEVKYEGETCNYTHMMFLDDLPGITAGRERFGFPKKWGRPKLEIQEDTLWVAFLTSTVLPTR